MTVFASKAKKVLPKWGYKGHDFLLYFRVNPIKEGDKKNQNNRVDSPASEPIHKQYISIQTFFRLPISFQGHGLLSQVFGF